MIEQDVLACDNFMQGANPYDFVSTELSIIKERRIREKVVRNWCYPKGSGGTPPTLEDFLNLVLITQSKRPLQMLSSIIDTNDADTQAELYGECYQDMGKMLEDMGKKLQNIASVSSSPLSAGSSHKSCETAIFTANKIVKNIVVISEFFIEKSPELLFE
ncbi:hypothetical protein ACFL67_00435 [candidate division KSB1 bacterium]